ncbi:MAG: Uma2 family endonuclease [Dehalococcoidia bacterium]
MSVSIQTYEQVALEDDDEQWELVCGRLRKKPGMTLEHNVAARRLAYQLTSQLAPGEFAVDMNGTRLRVSTGSFYLPDLCVIPHELERRLRKQRPGRLEVYEEPMPLVVEVWSPSTGDYDVEIKLKEYQLRGDAEIWRIHPYERTLISWRRQPDGMYRETLYSEGSILPIALPNVSIAIAALFE